MTVIDGIRLDKTCYACPEQYDAYLEKRVGYLRLRNGYFAVYVPDAAGKLIYDADTQGDGIFEKGERDRHLAHAVRAIRQHLNLEEPLSPVTTVAGLLSSLEVIRGVSDITARFGKHGQKYRIRQLVTEDDGSTVILLGDPA